ncbi:MAG: NADH-quinone oxidoreductase subunit N [Candidatus Methanomarinus sp.]|uniref:NADH-quinone oxidoreductase subunit N n=1 Tax=Candidatus Methanomarinus sp. TaxID=3386244 RepID=A0AC61SCQ3_9EURY|nr:MAG: NADH-quinone oxidoreductase subunit N [ANME-2 cluster archaeon]
MSFTFESLIPFAPEIILVIAALTVMIIGLFMETSSKKLLGYFSIVALLASIAVIIAKGVYEVELTGLLAGSLTIDPLSQFFKLTFLLVSLLVVIASIKEFEEHSNQDEYYTLILLGTVGMMIVASAVDIVTMFIGFELASLSTYVLAGFNKNEPKNIEAAIKYFVIGAVSSTILLFGLSYLYGLSGGLTNIDELANFFSMNAELLISPMGIMALVMITAGFGFKMALVPFHMWAPDVYQGSPSVISALLAAGSKKMAFVAAFRVLLVAMIAMKVEIGILFAILAVATMTLGNLVTVSQKSIKRMLAYSSIAQAGYIAMVFVVVTPEALTGGILYVMSHAFMKAGAFITVGAVCYVLLKQNSKAQDVDHIDNFAGLGKRSPFLAFSMLLFLFALAGIPPTAGFVSKFILFLAVLKADYLYLVVIAILNSALSLYYYARVVKYMYVLPPASDEKMSVPTPYVLAIVLAMIGVLAIGIVPEPFVEWAASAAEVLFY